MSGIISDMQIDGLIGTVVAFVLALTFMGVYRLNALTDPNLAEHRASHVRPTSRLGGVAVSAAVLISLTYAKVPVKLDILLCALPVFLMGLSEDLHYTIKPKIRLGIASVSASTFIWVQGSLIQSVGLPIFDDALSLAIVSALFTTFCLVALTNALNFIDGINGLASGKTMIVSGAIWMFSMSYNEPGLAVLSLAIFTSTLGLFMLNYPQGRIFMGDAGAYTLGFLLAGCLITLHHRHPEISPWAILLVIFWPIADMAHSIVRRRLGGKRPDRPDMMHMHHVVMRTLSVYSNNRIKRQIANPIATALILPLAAVPVICGYVFRENNMLCMSLTLAFFVGFFALHASLVRLSKSRTRSFKSIEA
ncbi:UDP-N-acetylmuramyl pentapeptide phosphotransferase/UDP-N-acetylglucosamine-1-phosphate transferase [Rhodobacteraceae bacterium HIMB11]|nr:UDP-N-acetylmuramyl pentapeptide phosphotransferase/UDP-N-acetylglucosamine-1-phosphate transferase [Rhodobacteraceae bacterium HIMB11]